MLRVVAVGLHVTCFASTLRFGGVGRKGSAKLTGVAQKTHARSAFVEVSFGGPVQRHPDRRPEVAQQRVSNVPVLLPMFMSKTRNLRGDTLREQLECVSQGAAGPARLAVGRSGCSHALAGARHRRLSATSLTASSTFSRVSMTFRNAADLDFAQDVIRSDVPVLLKFSAGWCGPCKAVAPVIESIAGEYADEMTFVSVDIDQSPEIAQAHGVRGVPAFVVIKDGKVTQQLFGLQTRTTLAEMIETAIGAGQ